LKQAAFGGVGKGRGRSLNKKKKGLQGGKLFNRANVDVEKLADLQQEGTLFACLSGK